MTGKRVLTQVHRSDRAVLQGAERRVAVAPLPRHRESGTLLSRSRSTTRLADIARYLPQWLTGDVTNLLGSLWQGLIPTVIILALCVPWPLSLHSLGDHTLTSLRRRYYTICDVILIGQVFCA